MISSLKIKNKAAQRYITFSDKEFGKRLMELIQNHGMDQSSLCNAIGISRTTMHYWVTGFRNMRVKNFALIVDALGLTTMETAYLLEAFWMEDEDG